MKKETILAVVRHGLTFGGGIVTQQGLASDGEVTELVGALITVIGIMWSILDKRAQKAKAVPTAVLLLGLAGVVALMPGCATSNKPGRVLASAAVTVDAAMMGWGEWVKAGQATAAQETAVKSAYIKYQSAELAAEKAYIASIDLKDVGIWTRAAEALRAAQVDLLQLIDQFKPAQPATK